MPKLRSGGGGGCKRHRDGRWIPNPSLAKDFSVLVVDARRGIGNGRVIPAGPLRAPLDGQLDRAQALIVVGEGDVADVADQARKRSLPVFRARLTPDPALIASLAGKRVLAFAGIGDPEKFFATLRAAGVAVATTRSFDDHHRYTRADVQSLCAEAERSGLVLVTTEKDLARMQGDEDAAPLAARSRALPVTLTFDDDAGFAACYLSRSRGRADRSSPDRAKRYPGCSRPWLDIDIISFPGGRFSSR